MEFNEDYLRHLGRSFNHYVELDIVSSCHWCLGRITLTPSATSTQFTGSFWNSNYSFDRHWSVTCSHYVEYIIIAIVIGVMPHHSAYTPSGHWTVFFLSSLFFLLSTLLCWSQFVNESRNSISVQRQLRQSERKKKLNAMSERTCGCQKSACNV